MQLPAEYRAAQRAMVKAARTIPEAKDLLGKSISMEVWAYQAKDPELVTRCVEVREWATRRIGELMEINRKAGKLAKGSRGAGRPKIGGLPKNPPKGIPTLLDQGVDKPLADRARKAERMPLDKFEARIAKQSKIAVAAIEGMTAVIKAARAERHAVKAAKRAEREKALGDKVRALPTKKYVVIVADPEWRFEFFSDLGRTNSSAENHYPTSTLDVIKARDVASIAATDSVLFLWATVPMEPQAHEVMAAWGFKYVSQFVWIKDKAGTGYWNRNKHELLLIGTRGKPPAPAEGTQWESAIVAALGEHSAKPEIFLEMIESYFPTVPKIELNRRGAPRPNWDAWGNEAETEATSEAAE